MRTYLVCAVVLAAVWVAPPAVAAAEAPALARSRTLYNAGAFGKLIYSEGEYYHYMEQPIDSYKGWRIGLPPQWYPTHSNAYYVGASGGIVSTASVMTVSTPQPRSSRALAGSFTV